MPRKRALSAAQQRDLAELWANPRCTTAHLCRVFDVSGATIAEYVTRLGLPKRSQATDQRLYKTEAQLQAHMAKMWAAAKAAAARRERTHVQVLDREGEKVSAPPRVGLRICATCGTREAADRPHQHGREAA